MTKCCQPEPAARSAVYVAQGEGRYLTAVRDFHEATNVPIKATPNWDEAVHHLRVALHKEEYLELRDAMGKRDLVATADALADLIYVLCGTALAFGIPLDEVFAEVHRSNMTKAADGLKRADGKVAKGPNFSPPDIAGILARDALAPGEPA